MEVDNKEDTKEWMRKTKYKNSCLSPEPQGNERNRKSQISSVSTTTSQPPWNS